MPIGIRMHGVCRFADMRKLIGIDVLGTSAPSIGVGMPSIGVRMYGIKYDMPIGSCGICSPHMPNGDVSICILAVSICGLDIDMCMPCIGTSMPGSVCGICEI